MSTLSQDNILRTLVVEKALIQHSPVLYLKIVETLSRKYGKGIPDFTQPERIIDAIKETCGDSFDSIIDQMQLEVAKYGKSIPLPNTE